MSNKATIVGKVWNPNKKMFQSVIGYDFPDSPGYFQLFVIGTKEHFRKRLDHHDQVTEIPLETYDELDKL